MSQKLNLLNIVIIRDRLDYFWYTVWHLIERFSKKEEYIIGKEIGRAHV